MNQTVTAGFVGFGEVNTPIELIRKKCAQAVRLLASLGIKVLDAGTVADDPAGKQADAAAAKLKKQDFDFLIVCVAGWIPSWAVIRAIEPFKHLPMLLWGLSGSREGARFVTTADQAGTTALRHPMAEMQFRFKYVVNRLGAKAPTEQIASFARACAAARQLRAARIGMAGYRDMRLYGTLYDGVSLKERIGPEIEHFDLLEIERLMAAVPKADLERMAKKTRAEWRFLEEPKPETLRSSARLCLALKRKIEERGYDGISYCDVDGIKKLMKFAPAGALAMLHDAADVCTIPENDSLGAVTQLMIRFLTGQCAAYLEFYEFTPKGALMGVPDYVPGEIVDGKVTVMPKAFGSFGEGLLNVSRLKTGPVTIARLGCARDGYMVHAAAGAAATPPAWEEAGWSPPAPQLPGLEIELDCDTENFIQNALGQHYILAYGNILADIRDLCRILNIKMIAG